MHGERGVRESKGLARGTGKEGGALLTAETPQFYTCAPRVWRLRVLKYLVLYFISFPEKGTFKKITFSFIYVL